MWILVDFATPDGRTWGYDPNRGCERHYLYPEPHAIADRLLGWLREDNRLNNWRPKLNRHCKACRD